MGKQTHVAVDFESQFKTVTYILPIEKAKIFRGNTKVTIRTCTRNENRVANDEEKLRENNCCFSNLVGAIDCLHEAEYITPSTSSPILTPEMEAELELIASKQGKDIEYA